ncbi:archaemetzincin [Pedobacter ghigonis]|uniref:archaemetzincin n=1 Tax=Pedobacter ghigonis TaxID=2730403 RepID=UPI00158C26F6|nr:archaemetzincin [Pedobacter ghigonis]
MKQAVPYLLFHLFTIVALASCNSNSSYFSAVAQNDIPLKKPQKGDWLFNHQERIQTLANYHNSHPLTPNKTVKTIYLKPIGEFSVLEWKQIQLTRGYLEKFFQLNTVLLPKVNNNIVPPHARRISQQHEQLLATYIRDTVVALGRPKDAIAMLGITEMDLFPNDKWNFVFGLASYDKGLAVNSIYRFHKKPLTNEQFTLSLERLLKTASHEIGHIFGLTHCVEANCLMNGANSLAETDRSTARLCSKCQQKLNSNLKYDNRKRLKALAAFFNQNKLGKELQQINADLKTTELQ